MHEKKKKHFLFLQRECGDCLLYVHQQLVAGGLLALWTAISAPPASPVAKQLAAPQDDPFQVGSRTVCKLATAWNYEPPTPILLVPVPVSRP